jgi:hypothetical protein
MKRCLCLVVSNNKVTFLKIGLEDKEVIDGDSFSNFEQKPINRNVYYVQFICQLHKVQKINASGTNVSQPTVPHLISVILMTIDFD